MWYGTPELWTVLSVDGTYPEQKSVWWSVRFPGGTVEEDPDITSASPGTNAYTPEEGWFMIADFPVELPAGCWEIRAAYKGASLSYVVAVP